MQELRLVLIIVGTLAIAALLLHGLWSSRKEKPAKFGEKPIGKLDEATRDTDGFDRDGVGSVRVVEHDIAPPTDSVRLERKEPALHFGSKLEADPLLEPKPVVAPVNDEQPSTLQSTSQSDTLVSAHHTVIEPQQTAAPLESANKVEPNFSAETVTLESTLTIEDIERDQHLATDAMSVAQSHEQPPQPSNQATTSIEPELTQEPVIHEVDVGGVVAETVIEETVVEKDESIIEETIVNEPVVQDTLPPDFLVLNVHARNGDLLRGSKLFNAFEQHNLIFGENAVYHRHRDLAGTGPVVFTVTNMVHPAHFPEGGSDSFETPGVAFYLMLPCEAERADLAFNQMLQTVQRIADSMGADVLDHERSLITPRRIGEYREKALRYTPH